MTDPLIELRELVLAEISEIRVTKGLADILIGPESVLLSDDLGLDSLDLATLIVSLQEKTQLDPFRSGFIMFRTVGELVDLFSAA
jgi:acyl carrier protein